MTEFVHHLPVRIYYEDTDFSGVVYHANYLKFAERGRSEFLRAIGVHHYELAKLSPALAFAIVKMNIDFLSPARIDDELMVETRFTHARGARLSAEQKIYRDETLLWQAHIDIACIDEQAKPKRLPESVKKALEMHMSGA